jgi:hypothetical protein
VGPGRTATTWPSEWLRVAGRCAVRRSASSARSSFAMARCCGSVIVAAVVQDRSCSATTCPAQGHCVLGATAGDGVDEVVWAAVGASGGAGDVGVAVGPMESHCGRLGAWIMSRSRGPGDYLELNGCCYRL